MHILALPLEGGAGYARYMPRGKRNTPRKRESLWTDFEQVYPMSQTTHEAVPLEEGETYWKNSFYTVFRKDLEPSVGSDSAVRLSIKHNQGKAIREWKHLQRIKNELVGADREAVEIFPPESMVTSLDNEHHLFVTPVGVTSIYVYEEKARAEGLRGYSVGRGTPNV
jgi:hypothetical protein